KLVGEDVRTALNHVLKEQLKFDADLSIYLLWSSYPKRIDMHSGRRGGCPLDFSIYDESTDLTFTPLENATEGSVMEFTCPRGKFFRNYTAGTQGPMASSNATHVIVSSTCISGKWFHHRPTSCHLVQCPDIPENEFANRTGISVNATYQDTFTDICLEGSIMSGGASEQTFQCNEVEMWNPEYLPCLNMETTSPPGTTMDGSTPGGCDLDFSIYNESTGLTFTPLTVASNGSVMEFTCQLGKSFRNFITGTRVPLQSSNETHVIVSSKCINGEWLHDRPTSCDPVQCPNVPEESECTNRTGISVNATYLDTYTDTCLEGCIMYRGTSMETTFTCTELETWDPDPETSYCLNISNSRCTPEDHPPIGRNMNWKNLTHVTEVVFGTVGTWYCHEGWGRTIDYFSYRFICWDDGTWEYYGPLWILHYHMNEDAIHCDGCSELQA
ncbi:unnamed protein product, partial [Cyprideis torosa]